MNTDKKITYLMGAGASQKALPLVKQIPSRIDDTSKWLRGNSSLNLNTDYYNDPHLNSFTKASWQLHFYDSLDWLRQQALTHASVDTFAKKLFITENKDLIRLKATLTLFFIIEQIRNPVDDRYDAFFASLLEKKHGEISLPSNINILTWNYDFQLERAFSAFSGSTHLEFNQEQLGVLPSSSYANRTRRKSVFKLNGTTAVFNYQDRDVYPLINEFSTHITIETMSSLIEVYAGIVSESLRYTPLLNFSWEREVTSNASHQQIFQTTFSEALGATKDTEILVVVGYSFPFFNRDVDREIIGNMDRLKNGGTVYFQAPNNFPDILIDLFGSILPPENTKITKRPIREVEQFWLPHEL